MNSKPQDHPVIGPDHQLPGPVAPAPRHTMMKIIVSAAILFVFAVAFVMVLRTHDDKPKPAEPAPTTVTVVTAKKGDIGQYVDAIGNVIPVYTAAISSQVSGLVTDVHFVEGQLVAKGDPLIEIDSRPYRATLLQAQGTLDRDEALLAQAQMDLERYQAAWARNAIPKQTLDDQGKLVLQDKGTVKLDQGIVDFDQIQVDYCHITAPIAGRVGLRLVDPGNVVTANGNLTLAVITQLSPINVVFTMAEDDIGLVESHVHDGKKLAVDAYDRTAQTKIESGFLLTLDNQVNMTTGTVRARCEFSNKRGKLFPNQFVNVRLLVTTLRGVTLIPTSSLQHNGQTSFVYVIKDQTAHMQNVTAGITDGAITQVQGIDPGDEIANSGFEKLQDKSKVTIAQTSTTAPSSQPTTAASTAPSTRPAYSDADGSAAP